MVLVCLQYVLSVEHKISIRNLRLLFLIISKQKIQFSTLLASMPTGGIFGALFNEEDAIISDALNHASIIDGVRLCKAKRYRYANGNMEELEKCLQEAQAQRFRIVVTDGVFSMDGNVAPMDKICDLAEKYDALVMVDEATLQVWLAKLDTVLANFARLTVVLIFTQAHLVKHLVVHLVVSLLVAKR